ncbi:hypothetical protein GCM10011410_18720 [Hoyosella rhizosphaerae]|uniref:ComF family protein n=2 Tax=Hoyosella rhizosphaerae TaxID=1755582 RepID=A0A916XFB2_9ACTN|nr:hypothetical protein GCM10011410_18720 [Hoyosella rhizosphaerae]
MPVWSVTPYRGAIRRALVQWKEHGRTDLQPVLVHRLAYALASLLTDGELSGLVGDTTPVMLIPAPSRWLAHRKRGAHPVRDLAWGIGEEFGDRRVDVAEVLRLRLGSRDAVGLTAAERVVNVRGKVVLRRNAGTVLRAVAERSPHVILIDDIVTTGALLRESASVLRRHGVTVTAAVVFAAS